VLVIRPPQGVAEISGKLKGAFPPLLAWLNPIFSSAISGRADVRLQNVEIPSRHAQAARIEGIASLQQVRLAPDGVLGGVLTVAGVPSRADPKGIPISLPPVRFTLEQGQISCSDFQLVLDRRTIRMTGSVGLNGALNLFAQVPTPTAGPLSTATVTVPIRGTLGAPAVSAAE